MENFSEATKVKWNALHGGYSRPHIRSLTVAKSLGPLHVHSRPGNGLDNVQELGISPDWLTQHKLHLPRRPTVGKFQDPKRTLTALWSLSTPQRRCLVLEAHQANISFQAGWPFHFSYHFLNNKNSWDRQPYEEHKCDAKTHRKI